MEGGLKILERFASKRYKRKKIELVSKHDKTFVPKRMAAQVLDNMQRITELTTGKELAEAMGKKYPSFISLARSEKALLRLEHLELVAEKFDITVDDLLTLPQEGDVRKNKVSDNEYDETIYIKEINMVMQKACLFAGSLAETSLELDKKKFFLGYLLEKLPGYELCFSSKKGEVSFRNGKFTYTWNIQHLEFD
jgi:transcriptional regulator with XRE-family HTH domain